MNPIPGIALPLGLSAETALALFNLLYSLNDALWQYDELEIADLTMEERNPYPANQQALDFDGASRSDPLLSHAGAEVCSSSPGSGHLAVSRIR